MRIIAIANQKGGTGKTTTAVNLAAALARHGKRVLLIDLDPQGNASTYLGCQSDGNDMLDMLERKKSLAAIIRPSTFGVDVAPSGKWVSAAEKLLARTPGGELVLRAAVKKLETRWDIVIMDCPPSVGMLTSSALAACTEVLIPVHTEAMPLEGVAAFLETIEGVRELLNPGLRITGFVAGKTNATKLSKDVEGAMRESLGNEVFTTVIRTNVKLGESYSHRAPITHYAPKSPGAKDYDALAVEVIGRAA